MVLSALSLAAVPYGFLGPPAAGRFVVAFTRVDTGVYYVV